MVAVGNVTLAFLLRTVMMQVACKATGTRDLLVYGAVGCCTSASCSYSGPHAFDCICKHSKAIARSDRFGHVLYVGALTFFRGERAGVKGIPGR